MNNGTLKLRTRKYTQLWLKFLYPVPSNNTLFSDNQNSIKAEETLERISSVCSKFSAISLRSSYNQATLQNRDGRH